MEVTITACQPEEGASLHAAAHRLLALAAEEAGIALPLGLEELPGGKPYCPAAPAFHFNLSHSGGWAVCAVAPCPVGVDVQEERPVRPALLRKFSPGEQAQLAVRPASAFFDLWALKEAAAKCTGRCGVPGVLYGSEVSLDPLSLGRDGLQGALAPFPVEGVHLAAVLQCREAVEVRLRVLAPKAQPT